MPYINLIPSRTTYALNSTISTSPWATTWQRIYRQVFWLADGQRDIDRIALLIHKQNMHIKQIAEELAVTGYLSLSTDKKVLLMNVELLKKSFEMVAPYKEVFARGFYERLFTDYPTTQALFARTDMKRQEGALMATLAVVVAGVERGENFVPIIQQLGEKHRRYGAMAEHYPIVGAVLLEMFHRQLGERFTVEMQEAWSQAFELISSQMLTGIPTEIS